ncbi:MAG TPA: beta-propeller fold lactonase family protein [Bryobacterales bacterium]|jgi:uncharacterized protein (TIGR03437 family)|nr:beta-propeller fold lactonase family protein [Bryobacterales bacterium]
MSRNFFLAAALSVMPMLAQGVAYIVDNRNGQVDVFDLGSWRVISSIRTGNQAGEIYILPNNRFAFVSNQGDSNVTLLDLQAGAFVTSLPTGQGPGSLAGTPDGRLLYVANEGSNDVTVIDVARRAVVATIPVGTTPVQVNLSPDGLFVYVVNQDDGTITVIDAIRNQVKQTLPVGQQPNQIAIAANLNTAYILNTGSNSVSLLDLSTNTITGSVPVGAGPVTAAFSSDGQRLFVVNRDSNSVSIIDTRQNRVIATIGVGARPVAIAVTFDGKFAYVSNQGDGTVSLLDLTANAQADVISVGGSPFSVQFDPNENFLYVTNLTSGSISVIDTSTDKPTSVPVGGAPVQFAFLNAPTLLEISPNPAPVCSLITLKGEGFVPASAVWYNRSAFAGAASACPAAPAPAGFVDSETWQAIVPPLASSSAGISVVNPDGNASEQLVLQIAPSPSPVIISPGGVVEGAGFQKAPYPISGGSIVSVFGSFPGASTDQARNFPLPTTLANVRVDFNGVPAALLYASPAQINAVAPAGLLALAAGLGNGQVTPVQVSVTVLGPPGSPPYVSAPAPVSVAAAAPGIFSDPASGIGAFLHGADLSPVTTANPARAGETIVLYCTGLGNTSPPPMDGQPAPADILSPAASLPVVTVGGAQANVRFAGLAPLYAGLYQINFDVPSGTPGGAAMVKVTSASWTSNGVLLPTRP